jgi:hypothetical protein
MTVAGVGNDGYASSDGDFEGRALPNATSFKLNDPACLLARAAAARLDLPAVVGPPPNAGFAEEADAGGDGVFSE